MYKEKYGREGIRCSDMTAARVYSARTKAKAAAPQVSQNNVCHPAKG